MFKKSVLILVTALAFCASSPAQSFKDYPITPVPFTDVHINKGFWLNRIETNRKVTIPYALDMCRETGRVDNFAIAGGSKQGEQCGVYPFDDSDVYKIIEGASYSLMTHPDPKLEKQIDEIIDLIAKAQEPDGYIYTARANKAEKMRNTIGPARWSNIQWSHELYNLGHLYEAATAHYLATKKKSLLNIALKSADLVSNDFGPGKIESPTGHEEIELGLVKLYRITGEKKYLNLAKFFLDMRGKSFNGRKLWGEYAQDHKPVIEQDEAVGHAVRAAYLYSAMTDIAAMTGDSDYNNALDKLWENVAGKKLYVTGGIGARGSGEAFGDNYELPNMSAYNETCSSIANVYWNYRMFLLHGDSKYIDVMERTLYNALLSGIGMEGNLFFYPNPLESFGTHTRSKWFACACCPSNVTRFVPSVPGYVYAVKDNNIYVNLYANCDAGIHTPSGEIEISQFTDYPWSGDVKFVLKKISGPGDIAIKLRIPSWAGESPVAGDLYSFIDRPSGKVKIKINGEAVIPDIDKGYAVLNRNWKADDRIEIEMPMEIRRITANDKVESNRGKIALQRGPIVYCAEWPDNNGSVRNILLTDGNNYAADFEKDLLNGVEVIKGKAYACKYVGEKKEIEKTLQDLKVIPYYAWAHRGAGEMSVWLADNDSAVRPLAGPTLASMAEIKVSSGKNERAINDQLEPKNSADESCPFFHWWPNMGTKEWVEFDFPAMEEISQMEIYWFDDTGVGECRVPESWRVYYKDGDKWTSVYSTDKYSVDRDRFNKIIFETVRTPAIKVEIQSQRDFAGGIQEIKIK